LFYSVFDPIMSTVESTDFSITEVGDIARVVSEGSVQGNVSLIPSASLYAGAFASQYYNVSITEDTIYYFMVTGATFVTVPIHISAAGGAAGGFSDGGGAGAGSSFQILRTAGCLCFVVDISGGFNESWTVDGTYDFFTNTPYMIELHLSGSAGGGSLFECSARQLFRGQRER